MTPRITGEWPGIDGTPSLTLLLLGLRHAGSAASRGRAMASRGVLLGGSAFSTRQVVREVVRW